MSEHLRALDSLRPGEEPLVLQESQDFWDDRSDGVVEFAQEEIEAAHQELAAALTQRWGAPRRIDLAPYLEDEDAEEPMGQLSQLCGDMLVWQREADWLALSIGQADAEFPIQLLAAAGTTTFP
ncbi:hypothetical protein [Allokutzneria sp. NRRL B-24872]|uniref:hypothetical protein n=1 Tax=Allokutzneria sp. NRRL B-24872 TaxID=1137961 RepID=UPI000A3A1861|nr:hypothetical protein [Allokutzneria sp. NRRL B-24872]